MRADRRYPDGMATQAAPTTEHSTDRPPTARRWIPLSLRMFLAISALLCVVSANLGLTTYRKFAAIRAIERIGGTVRMQPRGSDQLGPRIEDEWTSIFDDVDVLYFGHSSKLTDDCLAEIVPHLRAVNSVDLLVLDHTDEVTDAGLNYMKELTGLKILSLTRTGVTDAGIADLRAARPRLTVNLW